MTNAAADDAQKAVCARVHATPHPPRSGSVLGIARNVRDGVWPINGLRHPPVGATAGWYIWAGEELGSEPDFFQPVHVEHVGHWSPIVVPYLALPPGWRFLVTPDLEDVWFDASLLVPST